MTVLIVAYTLPPFLQPQAIQIGRLISYMPSSWSLYAATVDDSTSVRDDTLYPGLRARFSQLMSVRLRHTLPLRVFRRVVPLAYHLPDTFLYAHARLLRQIMRRWNHVDFDVVLTCPYPMSTALAGLYLKRRLKVPWITLLSDPWVDNPHFAYRGLARLINERLEARVFAGAAAVLVPSVTMRNWYGEKYPAAAARIHVLPHSFDPADQTALTRPMARPGPSPIVIRSVGSFGGTRTAKNLLLALAGSRDATALTDVRVELIGPGALAHRPLVETLDLGGMVRLQGPVSYRTSVKLMQTADMLLAIDAPIDNSPFLPSKVADYLGASRPILALTPANGELARLLAAGGGWVAPPDDPVAILEALRLAARQIRRGQVEQIPQAVRGELDATKTAAALATHCRRVVHESE